ncbi:MFS transporter [Agromyces aerolatus]|uniref:MFS transporter n=1 Tax=Agromyces sp. LY-1074 TaxID=3074080 RepID=UPI0028593D5E|nr:MULTISPECIES: MFS transporter [unclassified Agromyces]MDR5700528.1 MFS transporter [Agromyces sp. LY-1074]MDR5707049.1 MFS transporter [Agromyces sp. LY-1358]
MSEPRRHDPVEGMPRRGLSLAILIGNQLLAGIGVASGIAVAALLAQELTGTVILAGLSQTSSVLGAGLVAIPLARLAVARGRHVALATGYALAAVGAGLVITAAVTAFVPLVFLGLAAFGAGSAAGLQARFAATEVASAGFEARAMSLVLWATTLGSVAGPNLSEFGDALGRSLGLPPLVGPFLLSGAAFAVSTLLVASLLRMPRPGELAAEQPAAAGVASDAGLDAPDGAARGLARGDANDGDAPRLRAEAGGPVAARAGAEPNMTPNELTPAAGVAPEASDPPAAPAARPIGSWRALAIAVREPRALLALAAVVCSHTVMVAVMVMTPVHMHAHGLSLGLVGLVISIHILGMYGASPLVGWLVDRLGAIGVIGAGAVVLLSATLLGMLAPPDDMLLIPLALGLLGLGWSAGMIGGSALLTTSVGRDLRVPLQGASDASMNFAAALAAAFSGLVLELGGFAAVNVVAALVLVPLVLAGARVLLGRDRARARDRARTRMPDRADA